MSATPKMTVNQLKEALNRIPAEYGELPVSIWLPGSRVDLHQLMGLTPKADEILIEGNLREGSALS